MPQWCFLEPAAAWAPRPEHALKPLSIRRTEGAEETPAATTPAGTEHSPASRGVMRVQPGTCAAAPLRVRPSPGLSEFGSPPPHYKIVGAGAVWGGQTARRGARLGEDSRSRTLAAPRRLSRRRSRLTPQSGSKQTPDARRLGLAPEPRGRGQVLTLVRLRPPRASQSRQPPASPLGAAMVPRQPRAELTHAPSARRPRDTRHRLLVVIETKNHWA